MLATSLVMLSSQMALQNSLDVIANNVANASTTGYKREGIQFNTLLNGAQGTDQATQYVFNRGTYRDATAGTINSTGNPLDLAIQGAGYFQVQDAKGATAYTRDGAFRLDSEGRITTSTGATVMGEGGQPITLPEDSSNVTISGDGFITAQVGTGSSRAQLGKISVVTFPDEQKMQSTGGNLLTTNQAPTPVAGNVIVQGGIEESNVKPVLEMTEMIRIQRAYEQANNLISAESTRQTNAIDKLSQTS